VYIFNLQQLISQQLFRDNSNKEQAQDLVKSQDTDDLFHQLLIDTRVISEDNNV